MIVTLTDYAVLRTLVEKALPKLDFENNIDHKCAGQELLALLNRFGARLIYDELAREKETKL